MHRRTISLTVLAALTLLAAAAQAQKVYIDYDRGADLTQYRTFAFAPAKGVADLSQTSPLAHQHIIDSLRQRLTSSGRLTESASSPDLMVTYHVTAQDEHSLTTTGYGYGPRWGAAYAWGRGGWMSVNTTVNTYTVGTLIFDIWDARTEKAVWRGIATSVVPENPKKGMKKIDSALDKLAKKWQGMQQEGK